MHKKHIKILIGTGLIFLFFIVLSCAAHAATLYLSPATGSYAVGSIITVNVYVSNSDQVMNAASGTISFPKDKLEVVSLSKSGSIFNLWVQEPSFSNTPGIINFEGIVLNPGFVGETGKIISINFKTKAVGSSTVTFSSGSVLANDGKGTNILVGMNSGSYVINSTAPVQPINPSSQSSSNQEFLTVPVISSSTHPDENKWYSNSKVSFSWVLPKDITGVSVAFTQKSNSNPGSISDGLFDSKTYENISDGIWYFHLRFKSKNGWSLIGHFKVSIDTIPPLPFDVKIKNEKEVDGTVKPILVFEAKDELSGINYYEVIINEEDILLRFPNEILATLFKLPSLPPGKRNITVKAFDMAENSSLMNQEVNIPLSKVPLDNVFDVVSKYIVVILILIVIVGIMIFVIFRLKHKLNLSKKQIYQQTNNVEKIINRTSNILKETLKEQLDGLNKIKNRAELNKKKTEIENQFKKDIDITEKYIKREIKNK